MIKNCKTEYEHIDRSELLTVFDLIGVCYEEQYSQNNGTPYIQGLLVENCYFQFDRDGHFLRTWDYDDWTEDDIESEDDYDEDNDTDYDDLDGE